MTECFETRYGRYCLEDIRSAIKRIPDNSVDIIITDPPWGIRKKDPYDNDNVFYEILGELYRVLKPSGVFAVYYAIGKLDVLMKKVTEYFKYWWMFIKINTHSKIYGALGFSDYTPLLLFYKYVRPSRKIKVGDLYIGGEIDLRILKFHNSETIKQYKATNVTSVVLQLFTEKGDLVLDPFGGYGSIPFVAEKLGRRWMAFDVDRSKYAVAKKIFEELVG